MKKIDLSSIDWNVVQEAHNNGVFWCKIPKYFNVDRKVLNKALDKGLIFKIYHKRVHSSDTKQKISIARKKFLKNNPDKHPWRRNDKFKSKPCEMLKNLLFKYNINFIDEYQPSNDRYYAIDIAFPNKMIGIEINGNQHYNKDGSLKKYYDDRNNYLISIGWNIINVHYSVIYNEILLNKLVEEISKYSINVCDLEYYKSCYFKRLVKNKKKCLDCGCDIYSNAIRCINCNGKKNRKVDRPTKEELELLIEKNTWVSIGEKFGVSDNAVRKWAKIYNIIHKK